MSLQTSIAVAATRTARSAKTFGFEQIQDKKEDKEDEGADERKKEKVVLKYIKEWKTKKENGIPLSEEETKHLITLVEQLHIDRSTPYKAQKGEKGLRLFTWREQEDGYHKSFKQIQEENENCSEGDEEGENSENGLEDEENEEHPLGKAEAELIDLFEHFNITGKKDNKGA